MKTITIAAAVIAALTLAGCSQQALHGSQGLTKAEAVDMCINLQSGTWEVTKGMAEFDALRAAQEWCPKDGHWKRWAN